MVTTQIRLAQAQLCANIRVEIPKFCVFIKFAQLFFSIVTRGLLISRSLARSLTPYHELLDVFKTLVSQRSLYCSQQGMLSSFLRGID